MTHPSFTYTPADDMTDAEYQSIHNENVSVQVAARNLYILTVFDPADESFTHRNFKTLAAALTVAESIA